MYIVSQRLYIHAHKPHTHICWIISYKLDRIFSGMKQLSSCIIRILLTCFIPSSTIVTWPVYGFTTPLWLSAETSIWPKLRVIMQVSGLILPGIFEVIWAPSHYFLSSEWCAAENMPYKSCSIGLESWRNGRVLALHTDDLGRT